MIQNRIIKIGIEARNELIKGADFIAEAVKSTLGPFGANCAMEKGNRVTNDGVSIAREIFLKDEIQNRGAAILKEAAIKTNDIAGDGTTTAMTLAQAILKEAVNILGKEKTFIGKKTPAEVIQTIEKERKEIETKLISMSQPITTEEQLINSARISVEDDELGKMIGETQFKIGKEGVIFAEETAEPFSSVEIVKGVQLDNGFGTSISVNNQEKQTLEVSDVHVLFTNYTVQTMNIFEDLGKQLAKLGVRKLVVIARAFSSQAIRDCIENSKAGFEIYPINAPYVDQDEILKDLEAVLGGRYLHLESTTLESVQLSDLGFAGKIVAKRYSAIITGKDDVNSKERVDKRLTILRDSFKGEVSEFIKKNLNSRIAQLSDGFAIFKVGATSEIERKYKKDKVDDAVNAVRAAYQEGIVPGAGLAFKTISEGLPDTYILKRPLLSIYNQIMSTAPVGWTIEKWVNDPVKILRVALQQACSVSSTLASAQIAIATENPKTFQEMFNRTPIENEE